MKDIIAGYGDKSKTTTAKDFIKAGKSATYLMAKYRIITQGFKAMGMTGNEDGGITVDRHAVPDIKILVAERAEVLESITILENTHR